MPRVRVFCAILLYFFQHNSSFCVCVHVHKHLTKVILGLHPLACFCSARVRVRLLTRRLMLRACDTGRRGGGGPGRSLCSACFARLALLGSLCSACFARLASLGLLCLACFARLASLGSRRVQAADALACAARSRPRENMGGLQWPLARAALLSSGRNGTV